MKKMQRGVVGVVIIGAGAVIALNSPLVAQPNAHGDRDTRGVRDDRGGRDDRGRGPSDDRERGSRDGRGPRGGQRRGPSVEMIDDVANLTPDQKKKVAVVLESMHAQMKKLHEDTKKQIDGILTAEQREKLEAAREQGPPHGPPPDGFNGPPPHEGRRGDRAIEVQANRTLPR